MLVAARVRLALRARRGFRIHARVGSVGVLVPGRERRKRGGGLRAGAVGECGRALAVARSDDDGIIGCDAVLGLGRARLRGRGAVARGLAARLRRSG